MTDAPVILWYRQDLRITDHPALLAADASGKPVIPCYILDDDSPGHWQLGGASRWWLHHSLEALNQELTDLGSGLVIRQGESHAELERLIEETGADQVFCSRGYEPWASQLEQSLHSALAARNVELKRYPGSLLFEPEQVLTGGGLPYKVFTPYWKACLKQPTPAPPKAPPAGVSAVNGISSLTLQDLALLPTKPDWASHWPELWQPGSAGAEKLLTRFFSSGLQDYSEGRNHPAKDTTSRLSPHLHFGEISPRTLWHAAKSQLEQKPEMAEQVDKFLSELGWREFSHHLLVHFPHVPESAFRPAFDAFPWLGNMEHLRAWQQGRTGYPIVDAGMRELWHTGYMHNRVRMITASFLTKHLLLPWRLGEDWFWHTLLDADLANNACGWQWVAGSGADASPYFRIFNPTLQGQKFDADGDYVRQWVPELAKLPNKWLHQPELAPADVLKDAEITLGDDYPLPIVDHKAAREAALSAYAAIKGSA